LLAEEIAFGQFAGSAPVYTLYGKSGSGSAAIEAALTLIRQPFRIVETATWAQNDAYAQLLAVNPLGQIPTLVLPDGTALSESAAILIHLGTTHDDGKLLPRDSTARAKAVRGLVYIAANCYAAISIIDYPQRWCTDADADEAVQQRIRAGTRARLHHHWELFADVFGNSPYLGGNELNALDLLAAVVSKWSGARQHLARHQPAFHDTLQRIESHPDVAAVFARHWPPTSKASTPNAAT
jgi:GST-like protein